MIILSQTAGEINGTTQDLVIDCIVDTAADLPAQNDLAPFTIVCPSTARTVDGERYMMNSAGTWVLQPSGVSLDLTGYYTAAEVDAAINTALASYTNTSDMNTAINTAIMSTQYINRGTELDQNGEDLDTITTPGRYFTGAYANMMTNLPSNFAGLALVMVVDYTTTTTGNRCRQTLYPAAAPSNIPVPHFWQRYMTGTGVWRAWVDFAGTVL